MNSVVRQCCICYNNILTNYQGSFPKCPQCSFDKYVLFDGSNDNNVVTVPAFCYTKCSKCNVFFKRKKKYIGLKNNMICRLCNNKNNISPNTNNSQSIYNPMINQNNNNYIPMYGKQPSFPPMHNYNTNNPNNLPNYQNNPIYPSLFTPQYIPNFQPVYNNQSNYPTPNYNNVTHQYYPIKTPQPIHPFPQQQKVPKKKNIVNDKNVVDIDDDIDNLNKYVKSKIVEPSINVIDEYKSLECNYFDKLFSFIKSYINEIYSGNKLFFSINNNSGIISDSDLIVINHIMNNTNMEKIYYFRNGVNDGISWIIIGKLNYNLWFSLEASSYNGDFDNGSCISINYTTKGWDHFWNFSLDNSLRSLVKPLIFNATPSSPI